MSTEAPEPTIDDLAAELKIVRRIGLPRIRERLADLPALVATAMLLHDDGQAPSIELMLRDAWHLLGQGPHGQVIGILFGLEQGHRGGNPADLRSKAADRAGYHSVDTFRKGPENAAISNFATQIVSLRAQKKLLAGAAREDRVEQIVAQIEALTTVESAELARRLRQRFGQ